MIEEKNMHTINIPAILIANIMGITILFVVAIGNFRNTKAVFSENQIIKIMFIVSFISCVVDPICFFADGKQGIINKILVVGCNTWLYFGNIVISFLWIQLVNSHLERKPPLATKIIINTICALEILLLVVNLFVPIVFTVDANNVYARKDFYWILFVFYVLFSLYGLVVYFFEKRKSAKLKFFPVWAFLVPAGIGTLIQSFFYGVSTITPFVTISIVCLLICLQNEFLYKDKLTGLYNRFYLNVLEKTYYKKADKRYLALMIDINNFKTINDTYGHKVGDQALIDCSNILRDIAGAKGEVIRYAGDEFIMILDLKTNNEVEKVIENVHSKFAEFSSKKDAPYQLSVSLGYDKLSLKDEKMDSFLDKIDKHMYENKRKHKQSLNSNISNEQKE